MFSNRKTHWKNRKIRWTGLAAVALSFIFTGLLLASPLHLPMSAKAANVPPVHQDIASNGGRPDSFADLVQRLGPTVVNIKVVKIEKADFPGGFPFPGGPFSDFFGPFSPRSPQPPETYRMQGAGSGVIISPDGCIITNHHVVDGAKEVTVTLADRQEYKARVIGKDPKADLAILKIDPKETLTAATLGDSNELKVGDWVLAIGNPFGLSNTVTAGIVSAKGRVIGAGPYDDFIQTDASINPGNSGGPLFNTKGEVMGINTAIIQNGQGIGFAIPTNAVKPLVPQLISKGQVIRGYLGVSIQAITPELAKAMDLKNTKGALVADVVLGSPADKGGMQRGDVVVALNGKSVDEPRDLSSLVAQSPTGEEAKVTLLREGKQKELTIRIGKLGGGEGKAENRASSDQEKWGLRLEDLSSQTKGGPGMKDRSRVLVAGVRPGSPADTGGVRPGDILLSVNRKPVHSAQEAAEAIAKTRDEDSLLLLLKRNEGTLFAALTQ